MAHRLPPALLFAVILVSASSALGQTIRGTVIEAASRDPVAAAEILVFDSTGQVVESLTADPAGAWAAELSAPGRFIVTVESLGFESLSSPPLTVPVGQTLEVEIQLVRAPLAVDPLVVTTEGRSIRLEAAGFYDRSEKGFGSFLTAEEIAEVAGDRLTEVLRRGAGVQVVVDSDSQGGTGAMVVLRRAVRIDMRYGRAGGMRVCLPALWLNEIRVRKGGMMPRPGSLEPRPIRLDELVHPENVAGVEIYPNAGHAPPRYGQGAPCGVILIWTKIVNRPSR